jgi:eukaryotic-like serine/threonine-protein kinase
VGRAWPSASRRRSKGADARVSVRAPAREVPPELEELCVRATARDPAARLASARELREGVERFLDGDRDLELRRAQARRHAEAAEAATDRALGAAAPLIERQNALQKVGRALALDPENRAAAALLVKLLTTPPAEVPVEAQKELARSEAEELRNSARIGAICYAVCLAFVPLVTAMGVRSWASAIACTVMMAAAAVSWVGSRLERPAVGMFMVVCGVSTAAIAVVSSLFGPYVVLPGVIAGNTMAFAGSPTAKRPHWVILIGVLGFAVPAVLEWAGVVPRAYEFADGVIKVLPRGVEFPRRATELMLFVMSLATIVGSAIFAVHATRARAEAERRLQLHAWQLRQLVA